MIFIDNTKIDSSKEYDKTVLLVDSLIGTSMTGTLIHGQIDFSQTYMLMRYKYKHSNHNNSHHSKSKVKLLPKPDLPKSYKIVFLDKEDEKYDSDECVNDAQDDEIEDELHENEIDVM